MHRWTLIRLFLAASLVGIVDRSILADDGADFFEARIRPVIIGTCLRCHGETKTSGSLRVDTLEALLKGGESGPAVVPGKPEESLLLQAIERRVDVSAMPPDKEKALRADQVADFTAWIKSGAPWPANATKFVAAKHWSFEPLRDVSPPLVKDKAWAKTDIDRFVLARQESAGVEPSLPADKLTLIRRATFDLTGLPPTAEAVEGFANDPSPQAFEKVVDRLLGSPAYGERWGQHWLDVARYADTAGETADFPVLVAWRYRNYVIDAFNKDKPYDEFLREQIAGDILANDQPRERYAELAAATGYLAISRRFGFDSENYHHLTIQDTIDTLGQSVLGLSLGCARCHDHKFDPVSARDYYALYGIFESSRYAFPGSEQKQRVRSMLPLLPPVESVPKWREHDARVATLSAALAKQKQPIPSALLRSLHDIDGDFELQAPAAGGSNGVLVQPWLYQGGIAITTAAQSPFKNLYPSGRIGASIPADAGAYAIRQAVYPRRDVQNSDMVHVNLDFRVFASNDDRKGQHRFSIGPVVGEPLVSMLISTNAVSLKTGDQVEKLADLQPGEWQNLQLSLSLKSRTVSGRFGKPGSTVEFANKKLEIKTPATVEAVEFHSFGPPDSKASAIEFDNLGIQDMPISAVSTEVPDTKGTASDIDPVALEQQLKTLTGIDGDLELQSNDVPPGLPWNSGPNSVVKLSSKAQSPFQNLFPTGEHGIHMPNRGEYDGFGQPLNDIKPGNDGHLFVGFDFRCASNDAGGDGSWRYYLGHGPGNSAAVEIFFNGREFFRRSGDATDSVTPIVIGEWYQVQLDLDLKSRSYLGTLASSKSKVNFSGQLVANWDGTIDYTFIDSYGHAPGVRPALDADNFVIDQRPLPILEGPAKQFDGDTLKIRRARVTEIRKKFATIQNDSVASTQELDNRLIDGPFGMTYGVVEGTPHDARLQLRGEPDQPGDEIPRGFVKVLGGTSLPAGTSGSGRLELARWITASENPLTARVMVNRIWQYHFGRGLVKTPNDFGIRGLPPTHPELLDHLAREFVESGWSIKTMHRLIMRSATYQQASNHARPVSEGSTVDTADLYTNFPRRRLSAEEIRDSILSVCGELDVTPGEQHPFPSPIRWGYSQHGPFIAVYDHDKRSIYLMRQRLKRHPFLALFDGADPNATTPERLTTTVPTQALFFLNDPFLYDKTAKWADRLIKVGGTEENRIEQAWRRALGRSPSKLELDEATSFLKAYRTELAALKIDSQDVPALAAYLRTLIGGNEFLHVD